MPTLTTLHESARQLAQHVQTRGDLLDKIDALFYHTYEQPLPDEALCRGGIQFVGRGEGHSVYSIGMVTQPQFCHIALRIFYRSPCDPHATLDSDFTAFAHAARYQHEQIPEPLCAVHWITKREERFAAMLVRDLTAGGTCHVLDDGYAHVRVDGEHRPYLIDPPLTLASPEGIALANIYVSVRCKRTAVPSTTTPIMQKRQRA